MATDINQILKSAQDTINSAVEAITETRKTQDLLEENIHVTDTKIGIHNEDTTSHEDIRLRLEDMPAMIQDPVISGPNAVESGESNTWTMSASPVLPSVTVDKFLITDHLGNNYEIPASENTGTFRHAFTGDRNSPAYFTVKAKGTYNYLSKPIKHNLLITKHLPPDLSRMTTTIPETISSGNSYTFVVSNVTDLDDDFKHFLLTCSDSKITLPPEASTGMVLDREYNLSVQDGHYGPGNVTFTIEAFDTRDLSSTAQVTVKLNSLPDLTHLAHTIPTYLPRNASLPIRLQGGTDIDGDTITYGLSCNNPLITFVKNSGIAPSEDVVLKVGDIAPATSVTITVTATDQHGANVTKDVTCTINTPPDLSKLTVTLDKEVYLPGDRGTLTIAGATDINGQTITYTIKDTSGMVSFTKTTEITDGEEIAFTIDTHIPRGNYNFDIDAVDMVGSASTRTATIRTNTLPDLQSLQTTLPAEVVPGKKITCSVSGAVDADPNQPLRYTITSQTPNVVLENATDIEAQALFSLTAPTEEQLARGETITLRVTVSDGLETSHKDITTRQNTLPSVNDVAPTLPGGGNITAGAIHKATISFPASTDIVSYNLVEVSPLLIFDKTTGIKPNESVGVITKGVATPTVATFTIVGVDRYGELSAGKVISVTIQPWIVTAAPSITNPKEGAAMNDQKNGFTMTWSAYATMAWTGEGNYPNN